MKTTQKNSFDISSASYFTMFAFFLYSFALFGPYNQIKKLFVVNCQLNRLIKVFS